MTRDAIQAAVVQMPLAEIAPFMEWLGEFQTDDWDRQIEEDCRAGRLDWLIEEADEAIRTGRYKQLSCSPRPASRTKRRRMTESLTAPVATTPPPLTRLEIQAAVTQLPPEELELFYEWLGDFQIDDWDRQIVADYLAGRHDAALQQAREEFDAGRCTPLFDGPPA